MTDVVKAFVRAMKEHYREMMQNKAGEIEVDNVKFEYRVIDFLSFMNEYSIDVQEMLMNSPIEVVSKYVSKEWPLYSVIMFEVDGKDVPIVFLLRPKGSDKQ